MKTISFKEFKYVLHAFYVEMKINDEDYKKLQNNEIDIETLKTKYEADYDQGTPNYNDSYIEGYKLI